MGVKRRGGLRGQVWRDAVKQAKEKHGDSSPRCHWCGRVMTRFRGTSEGTCDAAQFTIDHIIPLSSGGDDELHNVVAACYSCNQMRNCEDMNKRRPRNKYESKVARTKHINIIKTRGVDPAMNRRLRRARRIE